MIEEFYIVIIDNDTAKSQTSHGFRNSNIKRTLKT